MSDDQQRTAEALDPDEWGDDPEGQMDFPPDEPMGVTDEPWLDGQADSVAERAARELPDVAGEPPHGIRLGAPTDVLDDDEPDLIGEAAEGDDADLSAEEEAVHLTSEPKFRKGDSYLEP